MHDDIDRAKFGDAAAPKRIFAGGQNAVLDSISSRETMKNAFYTSLDMLTISFVRTGLPGTFLELDRFDDEINIGAFKHFRRNATEIWSLERC